MIKWKFHFERAHAIKRHVRVGRDPAKKKTFPRITKCQINNLQSSDQHKKQTESGFLIQKIDDFYSNAKHR